MQINLNGEGGKPAAFDIAATDGVQYYGEGSVFDGVSTATTLVTDGTRYEDKILGTHGNDIVSGGGGNDYVDTSKGDDLVFGGRGSDYINGGSGSDHVIVSSGNDVYTGGNGGSGAGGIDTLDYSLMKGSLDINLGKHTASVGSGHSFHTETVSSFEVVIGTTQGVDHVRGDHWDNIFVSAGADNVFRGGLGNDVLVGGSGVDTYVLTKKDIADGSVKTFENFTVGQDRLDVSNFLKGHNTAEQEFRFIDLSNSDNGHNTQVQALVGKQWVNMINLVGVNANDVGADHHHITIADLGILA
jgi:Ca2+-binding RTX toxin-like protein